MNDACLFWRKSQTSVFEPFSKSALHELGILFGFTETDEIIRVPHHRTFSRDFPFGVVDDSNSIFHSMERNIRQKWRNHASLRCSLFCWMKHLLFDVSSLEPLFDQSSCRNWTNGFLQMVVRDVVEGPFDVGIEDPFLGLVWTSQKIDFLDRIMSTSTWSEPVTDAFKASFPARFKGIFDQCLKAAVHHNRDS